MTIYEFYSPLIEQWVVCAKHQVESLRARGFEVRTRQYNQTPFTYLEV